jgi:hypothetical protein
VSYQKLAQLKALALAPDDHVAIRAARQGAEQRVVRRVLQGAPTPDTATAAASAYVFTLQQLVLDGSDQGRVLVAQRRVATALPHRDYKNVRARPAGPSR